MRLALRMCRIRHFIKRIYNFRSVYTLANDEETDKLVDKFVR